MGKELKKHNVTSTSFLPPDAYTEELRRQTARLEGTPEPGTVKVSMPVAGRPPADEFAGKRMLFWVRSDVEAWLRAKVAQAEALGFRDSMSRMLNQAVREIMQREEKSR